MKRYLERYAEPEAALAEGLAALGPWDECVVVPLMGEAAHAARLFETLGVAARHHGGRVLAIAVVNGREDKPEYDAANESLLASLRPGAEPLTEAMFAGEHSPHLTLVVIDRASPGRRFPPRQGVGLARKIGSDLALALFSRGSLRAGRFHTTDGDARVAEDYFGSLSTDGTGLGDRTIAWVHPYSHDGDGVFDEPHRQYEATLRHYEAGLRAAGSPYAFATIGSTMVVGFAAYAAVRGWPKLLAAEDFYLLDKLAKVGRVGTAAGLVRLVPRASARVPFGTGVGAEKIGRTLAANERPATYHPQSFRLLDEWLRALEAFALSPDEPALHGAWDRAGLLAIATDLDASAAFRQAAATRPDPTSRRRHLHTWFDAFRTLKFIHHVRDTLLGSAHLLPVPNGVGYTITAGPA